MAQTTFVQILNSSLATGGSVPLRCPRCGRDATFEHINSDRHDLATESLELGTLIFGERMCPNEYCRALVFFVKRGGKVLLTFPTERIGFDKENIPEDVLSVFEEAVVCHAERCYVASALMVRKTLEEICQNKGATGNNLYERIQDIKNIVVLPNELLEAMDELRLLGNDAAHVESRTYDDISEEEVSVGIDLTKEILKAVYQYENLLARLRSLRLD